MCLFVAIVYVVWLFDGCNLGFAVPSGNKGIAVDDGVERLVHVHDDAVAVEPQKSTSKGIRRQGMLLKHRNLLQRSLCPVVICADLCSSDQS